MIEIQKIRKNIDLSFLKKLEFDVFYYGSTIDERTNFVLDNININPKYNVNFDKEHYNLTINNKIIISLRDLTKSKIFHNYRNILIDSTSLDFPELLYLLYAINNSSDYSIITILYIEPQSYRKTASGIDEEFTLSEDRSNFSSLPLFSINSANKDKTTLLTFLGFENSRLGQILKSDDGNLYTHFLPYIAVPAYQAGWENISLNKHLDYFNINNNDLKLYPSNNPYKIIKDLDKVSILHKNLVIAPLGTKPSTIGAIIFLINNIKKNNIEKQIGAIYDYPIKSKDRSNGIGNIYTYTLSKSIFS